MYRMAKEAAVRQCLNQRVKLGSTACVILSRAGKRYIGKNLVAACGLGYCAEQAAVTAMLNDGACEIESLLVIDHEGVPLTPCGRCLELFTQISESNREAKILLSPTEFHTVEALYPIDWKQLPDKRS